MPTCFKCGEAKEETEFLNAKKNRWCRECNRALARDWYAANPARSMLASARKRAKKQGLPFDITIEDIKIPPYCPALGIPLVPAASRGAPTPNSPSLDRIKPELGYVKGNVIVVSLRANQIKSNASLEEIKMVYDFYEWQMNADVAERKSISVPH